MTTSQFIAFIGAPLSLLIVGLGIYLWSSYADR